MVRNILVLTYWSFSDALIQTYTLPYLRILKNILPEGSTIILVTLEKENSSQQPVQMESGIQNISFPLQSFGIKAIFQWRKNISFLRTFSIKKNIDTIHAWCTPAGTIGYLLSRKTGIPLIIDSYEPHAEPMVETGTWKKGGMAFRILFYYEKKQTFHAKYLIGVVNGMKDYAKEKYGYSGNNFFFKPACINLDLFNTTHRKNPELLKKFNLENKIVCVYAGKFGGLYLTDEAFQFFHEAIKFWGDEFRILLLTSTPIQDIRILCERNKINPEIVLVKFVTHQEMPDYLGLGDFAFSAFKPVPSRKFCTPIKNGEYWAMGLLVIIPDGISEDSELIRSTNSGYVLKNLSIFEFHEAVKHIDNLIHSNKNGELSEAIHKLADQHRNFNIAESIYQKIYG